MKPELVVDARNMLGEAPLWHPDEAVLYWADIPQGRLFRYDPARDTHDEVLSGSMIGGFTIQKDGGLLLFMEEGAVYTFHHGCLAPLLTARPEYRGFRFNDVIADPMGRVFCGMIAYRKSLRRGFRDLVAKARRAVDKVRNRLAPPAPRLGALFRLDPDRRLTPVVDGLLISNGMAFTPDRAQLYLSDSGVREIYLFDYAAADGALSNRRLFMADGAARGRPDGMTVDAEGHVWSARIDGGAVIRCRPDGTIVQTIELPTARVTSLTFGGPDYHDLYITTAGGAHPEHAGTGAGGLFRLRPGVAGVPEFRSHVGL